MSRTLPDSPNPPGDEVAAPPDTAADRRRVRRIAARVLVVQALALLALWLLQARYHGAP
ncbi:MAG TPA: hypothetical protein VF192_14255 [Longimicrobiales bacterium]